MSSTKSPSLSCSNSVTDDNSGADQIDFSGVIDPALLALSHPTQNNNHSANDDDPTSLFVEDTESNQSSIDNLPADDDYDDDHDDDYDNDYDDTSSDFLETEANQSSTNNFPADADDEEADNSIEESDDDGIPVKKRKISGNRSRQIVKQAQKKPTSEAAPRAAIKTSDSYRYGIGYNDELPPLSTVREWFQDLTEQAVRLGLLDAAKHLNKRPLRVATMCSGTESPLLALRHISKNLSGQNSFSFELDHLFSAEIVPYKQAFIERNFKPPVIFADITELSEPLKDKSQPRTATTAYGAKAIVPSDLDLLMAGFVCSDYSMLNNARKGLEDRGESGDTFYAIKDYAQENKPKIIILENVVSVPWTDKKAKTKERGLDVHFEEIGYSSRHLILDTKEFYVPQTRRRGYLIAIHRASFMGTAAELIKQLDNWAVLVKKLKRHASVPAERLLLKSDDPKLKFSQVDDFDQRKTVIGWERCARGHELYREALKLGQDHPVTNWAAGGFKKLPDHYKLFRGATERVCDTIDISHLRCIRRGFDDRYWNRDLELSQNVYRITDTTLSGIMPCITPTGFPFSTVRGCGLTGYESLKFQAMDADTLDVTNLSQGDLRNLAGNAMTSTVVGAVISAGLIAFHKILDKGTGVESKEKSDLTDPDTSNELLVMKSNPANHRKLPVRDAVRWASESRRLCYCEGRTELTTNKLQECVMCGHTTCISCGGNPKHLYSRKGKHLPTFRIQPFKFEAEIKKYIPMSICFNINQSSPSIVQLMQQMEGNRPKDIEKETWTLTIQAIKDALCSKVYFREIIRGESWHIHFSSSLNNKSGARLELVIAGHNVEWYLYATASSAEPLGSRLRKFVEKYPCARMLPVGDDITKGDWELYMPELKLVKAIIKGHGNPVETYNTQIGLEDVSEVCISNKCSVVISEIDLGLFDQDISGEYEYSPVCGQAYSSLHVKLSTKGSSRPTFLFFDHEKLLRNPKEDSFIFTDDIRRLDYGEYRRTFGRLSPEHHPSGNEWGASESVECLDADTMGDSTDSVVNASTKKKTTKAQKKGLKRDNRTAGTAAAPISDQIILLNESSVEQKVTIYRDGYWLKCPEISMDQLTQPKVQYQKLIETTPELKVIMCHSQQAIFTCTAEVTCEFSDRWVYDVWTELDKSSEEVFFKEFRWLLEQGLRIFDHCAGTSKWHPAKAPKYLCSPCAPRAPKVLWTCAENNKLAPFEDPSDARDYEHALKDRPVPLTVRYRIDKPANIEIKVGMDPITLVHRAWGKLALTGKTENISLSWRLITDDNSLSKPIFGAFTLLDSQNEQLAENPPGIIAHQLRPEQLRNLSWAINQESGLGSFTEEEIVEDRITHINYRAEGKAARKVPVTGGVLAHEVGFGKTLIMLALIDAQFQQAKARESEVVTGSIPIEATMVLCPSHLTLQWRKEVRKFLPNYKDYVLCIDSFKDLKSFTIQDFQDAKIIIVNRDLLNTELYAMAVARFAGMVELDTGASQRPFRCWYAKALLRIAHNLEALRAQPHTFAEYVSNQFEQDKITAQSTQAVIPSKRLTGAAYMNKSSNAATKGSTGKRKRSTKAPTLKRRIDTFNLKKVTKSGDISKFTGPILELFSFARVVVDEYTYVGNDPKVDQKQAATILQSIKARHKWLLSGTPAISDFHDIQKMAEFIGINLGAKDYTLMKRDVLNREVRDMTRTEKFLMYRDSPSPAGQQHRHERAQDFLNHFVRKDIAQIGPIETIEQLVLIEHPAAAKAVYYELTQFLTDSGFDLTKRVRSENHKSQMINGALFQCQDVEEILLLRAASAHSDIVKDTTLEDSELCQKVVKIREEQYLEKKDELEKAYKLARRIKLVDKSSAGFYEGFIEIVTNNVLGDKETSDEIGNFILQADKEPVDPPSDEEKRPTLRQISTSMGTTFNKLVGLRRCWRFAETICYLQGAQANIGLQCSKCGKKGLPIGTLTVLGQCGHLVCSGCLPASYKHCSEPKCLVRNTQSSMISASAFISGGSSDAISKRSKIDHVVNLIETIPPVDKVIVFVQFPKLLKEVQEALEDKNINVCELSSSNRPTDVLEMFENEDSERVLILNIGDASAAGSNLTVANHVIFVAPYHTKGSNSQYTYDAAMTQAIGRARRFGQQKTVYIYHFLVKGTVDIDIMEFRTSRIVKQTGPDSGALVQGDREESEFGTPFYQYVSRDDD